LNYDNSTSLTLDQVRKAEFRPISTSNRDFALENGELELMVGNVCVLSIPINQINKPESNISGTANGFNLNSPILIKEDETIGIRIIVAKDETLYAAANTIHFAEVILKGDEISSK
jgi:hypothetical protein